MICRASTVHSVLVALVSCAANQLTAAERAEFSAALASEPIPDTEIRRALRSVFTPQAASLDRSDAALTLPMDANGSRNSFTFVGFFETEIGYSQMAELSRQHSSGLARSELTSYFARAGIGGDIFDDLRASLLIGAGAFYSSVSDFTQDGAQLSDARPQELGFSGWIGFGLRYQLNDNTELRFSWELYDDVLLPETGFAGDIAQWRMIFENRWR
jgi:hypothetical protein